MLAGYITFDSIPEIGFAHHHFSGKHTFSYEKANKSFEIVYISSGTIAAEFNGKTFFAREGDIFVLFRQLPIVLHTCGDEAQSHCTVQLEFDYTFNLIDPSSPLPYDGIVLPFITRQCAMTREIKKDLYEIIHQISNSPDHQSFRAALKALDVMKKLDSMARSSFLKTNPSHAHIASLVESYVKDNIDKKIRLSDVSAAIGKSPNYINFAFKSVTGTTITEYINEKKISAITTLMLKHNMHFGAACHSVGISDISYGYSLFKKHTGLTPNMFLKSDQILTRSSSTAMR